MKTQRASSTGPTVARSTRFLQRLPNSKSRGTRACLQTMCWAKRRNRRKRKRSSRGLQSLCLRRKGALIQGTYSEVLREKTFLFPRKCKPLPTLMWDRRSIPASRKRPRAYLTPAPALTCRRRSGASIPLAKMAIQCAL
jgi:hypothetical protein